jgi:hypothetical protein
MADAPTYAILNIPLLARNLASSRTPRLFPSVPEEYAEYVSDAVARGDWSIDPRDGSPLKTGGLHLEDDLEGWVAPRPHAIMPAELEDAAEAVWLGEPTLTARGERYRQLVKYHGNERLADIAFREEAERFGVSNPFSLQPGHKPGEPPPAAGEGPKSATPPLSTNPWHPDFLKRHSPEEAIAEQTRLIGTGIKRATSIARAAGVSVFGVKLK